MPDSKVCGQVSMAKGLLKKTILGYDRTPGILNTGDLVKKIEEGYLIGRENSFKQKKSFSPSALMWGDGACPRRWWLAFTGGLWEDFATPRDVANMENGTLSHERIQDTMEKAGILHAKETKVSISDPPIFGYCDADIVWDGQIIPAEIKTTKAEAFEYRQTQMKAAGYHMGQLLIYMFEKGADLGAVIYENKNTYELLIIPVEMTDERREWVEYALDWMRQVYKSYQDDTIPARKFRRNSKVCNGCPLQKACEEYPDKGDVDIPRLEVLK